MVSLLQTNPFVVGRFCGVLDPGEAHTGFIPLIWNAIKAFIPLIHATCIIARQERAMNCPTTNNPSV